MKSLVPAIFTRLLKMTGPPFLSANLVYWDCPPKMSRPQEARQALEFCLFSYLTPHTRNICICTSIFQKTIIIKMFTAVARHSTSDCNLPQTHYDPTWRSKALITSEHTKYTYHNVQKHSTILSIWPEKKWMPNPVVTGSVIASLLKIC